MSNFISFKPGMVVNRDHIIRAHEDGVDLVLLYVNGDRERIFCGSAEQLQDAWDLLHDRLRGNNDPQPERPPEFSMEKKKGFW